ncbi:Aste57867_10384 [Aphanomyces stellatus]|uniref:Aste57867_10384 protein n=1 Tax=Aphanomyces stellatus TaxID=120398 RepID=A0A485KR59_9STRA|nr:hypothetical protein As57867_010344 [Aphanomyces stellatus]VFT87258.1 Aste57867_10384 [Aphanomyces stellatus]
MQPAHPTKMRALFLTKLVECSPINPSNLSILKGQYNDSSKATLPSLIGTEGSGVVVAAGGGWVPWYMVGKRVGIIKSTGGVWAEYVVVDAMTCITLPDDVSFEGGSSCFVNPLTAVAFVEIAQARGVKAIVHTAGASAVGKMLVKHAADVGVDVIAVVRRPEQAAALQAISAKYMIDTSVPDCQSKLTSLTSALGATLAFDAVAGSLTGELLECMPNGSEVQVYGGLSGQASSAINPRGLTFQDKKVRGFWLVQYLAGAGMFAKMAMIKKVTHGLKTTFETTINTSYALEQAVAAIHDYTGNMSDNKIAFKPPQST